MILEYHAARPFTSITLGCGDLRTTLIEYLHKVCQRIEIGRLKRCECKSTSKIETTDRPHPSKPHDRSHLLSCRSTTDNSCGTGRYGAGRRLGDGWYAICQCLEDIDRFTSAAYCGLVSSARQIAICLVLCPFATYKAATPTLVALLYTCVGICSPIAGVLALRDSQGRISVRIHV